MIEHINEKFNIPIVLFIFKRSKTLQRIIERIKTIKPTKIYLIADGPRNDEERIKTEKCRKLVESYIDWNCEIIKNYSKENRGVYENIAGGAKWVFEREEWAIFLEDDNLPELTFFEFCKKMLYKYKEEEKILWICGTNYLQEYKANDNVSYVFTRHLMPCGWASWSNKFNKYYDGELKMLEQDNSKKIIKSKYKNKKLFKQQYRCALMEKGRINRQLKPTSWDYQMCMSIRKNDLYGISPVVNQIENIGVDNESAHGGSSYKNVMTRRFCTIKTKKMKFPLKYPSKIEIDKTYEKKVGNIILYPFSMRVKMDIVRILQKILKINPEDNVKEAIKNIFR